MERVHSFTIVINAYALAQNRLLGRLYEYNWTITLCNCVKQILNTRSLLYARKDHQAPF